MTSYQWLPGFQYTYVWTSSQALSWYTWSTSSPQPCQPQLQHCDGMTAVGLGKGIWESCNSHYWSAILPWDHNHLILVTCGLCDPDKWFQLEGMHAVVRALCIMSLMAPCDMMPFTLLTTKPMGGQMIHINPTVLACGDNTRRNLWLLITHKTFY